MRVLLLGARGHIGREVDRALSRLPEAEVVPASRKPGQDGIVVDLENPKTFDATEGFDVIINATDTLAADPAAFHHAAIARGDRVLELAADAATCQRLLGHDAPEGPGTVLVGVGVFPGLSQLLARAAIEATRDDEPEWEPEVDIHIIWSILSGAGRGTCELMVDSLRAPRTWIEGGTVHVGSPLGAFAPDPRTRTPGGRGPLAIEASFCEPILLSHSMAVTRARTCVAPRPGAPRFMLAAMRTAAERGWFASTPMRSLLRLWFRFLRRFLAAKRRTDVMLVADTGRRIETLHIDDAMSAAGCATAATAQWVTEQETLPAGYQTLEALVDLDTLLAIWDRLGFPAVQRESIVSPTENVRDASPDVDAAKVDS